MLRNCMNLLRDLMMLISKEYKVNDWTYILWTKQGEMSDFAKEINSKGAGCSKAFSLNGG